jgi:flagellar hook-associated protein 1 FlgK
MTLQYGSPAAVSVQLSLAGTPDNGFTLTLAEPTNPSAPPDYDPNRVRFDGDNARAMLALRDQVTFDGTTKLSDGYVAVFSGLASRINEAQTRQAFAQAQADDAEQRRANQAGVNLDEEAARLLQFQQAYQASAKYLQTVQSIFDTLIATFR